MDTCYIIILYICILEYISKTRGKSLKKSTPIIPPLFILKLFSILFSIRVDTYRLCTTRNPHSRCFGESPHHTDSKSKHYILLHTSLSSMAAKDSFTMKEELIL